MLFLIAATAAIVSPPPARSPTAATAQARAIVRIISAVRLRFGEAQDEGVPRVRETTIRTQGSGPQPAKLIEFE